MTAALAVPCNPTLDNQLIRVVIVIEFILPEPFRRIHTVKHPCHRRPIGTAANQVPADAGACESRDAVDDDALACAGLAGHDVESGIETDVRPFDHGDIFNSEFSQHGSPNPNTRLS